MADDFIAHNNQEKRQFVELLEKKDVRITELERESERSRLLADDINRKLLETQLLLEAAESASRLQQIGRDPEPASDTDTTQEAEIQSSWQVNQNREWDEERQVLEMKIMRDEQEKQELYAEKVRLMSKNATLQLKLDESTSHIQTKDITINQLQKTVENLETCRKKSIVSGSREGGKPLAQMLNMSHIAESNALSKLASYQRGQREYLKKIREQQETIRKLKLNLEEIQSSNIPGILRSQHNRRDEAIALALKNHRKLEQRCIEQDTHITFLNSKIVEIELEKTEMQQKAKVRQMELEPSPRTRNKSKSIEKSKENTSALRTAINQLTRDKKELETTLSEKEELCAQAAETIDCLKKEAGKRSKADKYLKEQIDQLQLERSGLQREVKYAKDNIESLEKKLAEKDSQVAVTLKEKDEKFKELNDIYDKMHSVLKEKSIEIEKKKNSLRETMEELESCQVNLHKKDDELQSLQKVHQTRLEEQQSEMDTSRNLVHGELRENQFNVQRLNVIITGKNKNIEELQDEIRAKNRTIKTYTQRSDSIMQKYKSLKREQTALIAKLNEASTSFKEQFMEKEQMQREHVKQVNELKSKMERNVTSFRESETHNLDEMKHLKNEIQLLEERLANSREVYEEKIVSHEKYAEEQIEREKMSMLQETITVRHSENKLTEQLIQSKQQIDHEVEKRREAEHRLLKEREDSVLQIKAVQDEFRSFRLAQEKMVHILEEQLEKQKFKVERLEKYPEEYANMRHELENTQKELDDMEKRKDEMNKWCKELEEQVKHWKERSRGQNRKLQELQDTLKTEREQARVRIETLTSSMHTQEEMREALDEMKRLKREVRALQEENSRKAALFSTLRESRAEEVEEANKKIRDIAVFEEKYERLVKDNWRKDNLIKEYRTKIQAIDAAVQEEEKETVTWNDKLKAISTEAARKERQVKELKQLLDKKKVLVKEQKQRITELQEQLEKRESQLKVKKSDLERVRQEEKRIQEESTNQSNRAKGVVLGIANAQVSMIEKLENDVYTRKRLSFGRNKTEDSSVITNDVVDGFSYFDTTENDKKPISLAMLNLTPNEFHDIMSSTVPHNKTGNENDIISKSNMAESELRNLKQKLDNDESIMLDTDDATRTLNKLIEARVELEKMLQEDDSSD